MDNLKISCWSSTRSGGQSHANYTHSICMSVAKVIFFLLIHPPERLAVGRNDVRLQRRLCGSRERLHRDLANPLRLPVGVSQQCSPQQRKP